MTNYKLKIINSQRGQILLLVIVFMAIVTTVVVALVGYAGLQIKAHRQGLARVEGLNVAEAGAELAIWKLNNQAGYTGETNVAYANGVYNVTITNLSASTKLIKVDSFVPDATNPTSHRTVQVTATTGTTNVGFNYGVQVGDGELNMSNSSKVVGNVYANRKIEGNNSAEITGTAIAASNTGTITGMTIDGNATAHVIDDSTIGGDSNSATLSNSTVNGNAVANSISNCTISGSATFDTKSSCTIGGSQTTPNPTNFIDPDTQPMPIGADQITTWENEAAAGGVISTQNITGSVALGPKKINGDLNVSNSGILTVTGTLWVTGRVTFSNSAIVKLSSSYGARSGVILAGVNGSSSAGAISVSNQAQVTGSGTSGSYLMLLSEMTGSDNSAITTSNNASVEILYAGTGRITISNALNLKEVTADNLEINNNATVTYEAGLASPQFSGGPAGGWELAGQSWQLLQ